MTRWSMEEEEEEEEEEEAKQLNPGKDMFMCAHTICLKN